MNSHYYKESCMCKHPMPSRIIPGRCVCCGRIIPPSVRMLYAIEYEIPPETRNIRN